MKHARFVKMTLALGVALTLLSVCAWGQTYQVLYNFTGGQDGADPIDVGNLAIDANGNLYGTTQTGGACGGGTLFELSPNGSGGWTETVLHSFCGGSGDGAFPTAAPMLQGSCILGNTVSGGVGGEGVEFADLLPCEISFIIFAQWAYVLNGAHPYASPSYFNYNGSPYFPSALFNGGQNGYGQLAGGPPNYEFCSLSGCADGANPANAVVFDGSGNLYGTTMRGGSDNQGVVYEWVAYSDECGSPPCFSYPVAVLHNFAGGTNDGAYPQFATLALTQTCGPNLCTNTIWGTTPVGGAGAAHGGKGYGTVFNITTAFGFSLVHSFNLFDGAHPAAGLTNLNGTFYGTTSSAGFLGVLQLGKGTIYSLTPGGTLTTLHVFSGPDGATPWSGLVADTNGNLYGVTRAGGAYGYGVVYEITP